MKATLERIEHWCTDGACGAKVLEVRGCAARLERWKLTPPSGYPIGFNSKPEALAYMRAHGWSL